MFNKISVAPLFNYTDRYCRYFYSLFTNSVKLYTGMINTNYFLFNYKKRLMINDLNDISVAIQLSGNNKDDFLKCVKIINKLNFKEININLGCPSKKAVSGGFGLFLMFDINKIINYLNCIQEITDIPVTLKHRISLNENLCYNFLLDFVGNISTKTKCNLFIIHARGVSLKKSTKYNLNKPSINYNFVYKLKRDLPYVKIVINGGIKNIFEIDHHLNFVDGVMLGRGVYFNPLILFDIHDYIYNEILFKNIKNKFDFFGKEILLNKISFSKENLDIRVKYIFHQFFYFIKYEINSYNLNPNFILKHIIHIFKGSCLASVLRKKLIYVFNNFSEFIDFCDFENFMFFQK